MTYYQIMSERVGHMYNALGMHPHSYISNKVSHPI